MNTKKKYEIKTRIEYNFHIISYFCGIYEKIENNYRK